MAAEEKVMQAIDASPADIVLRVRKRDRLICMAM